MAEPHYNPMSYHNGSVWPHDNGLIALGLARYGYKQGTAQIFNAMYEAATYMDLRRLPELFCGFFTPRTQCADAISGGLFAAGVGQRYGAGALLQATLGLKLVDASNEILFYQPTLPDFIDELYLRNLRLSRGSADVLLKRHGQDIAVTQTPARRRRRRGRALLTPTRY